MKLNTVIAAAVLGFTASAVAFPSSSANPGHNNPDPSGTGTKTEVRLAPEDIYSTGGDLVEESDGLHRRWLRGSLKNKASIGTLAYWSKRDAPRDEPQLDSDEVTDIEGQPEKRWLRGNPRNMYSVGALSGFQKRDEALDESQLGTDEITDSEDLPEKRWLRGNPRNMYSVGALSGFQKRDAPLAEASHHQHPPASSEEQHGIVPKGHMAPAAPGQPSAESKEHEDYYDEMIKQHLSGRW